MGFRFRKSLKLLPGVRLNVGTGGASLSLGVRGASVNVGTRGARMTVGIPGTGLSWSESLTSSAGRRGGRAVEADQFSSTASLRDAASTPGLTLVHAGSGRRMSAQQIRAAYERLQREEDRAQAQAELDQLQEELDQRLQSWRDMPRVMRIEDMGPLLVERPFSNTAEPPEAPDLPGAEEVLRREARLRAEAALVPLPAEVFWRARALLASCAGLVFGVCALIWAPFPIPGGFLGGFAFLLAAPVVPPVLVWVWSHRVRADRLLSTDKATEKDFQERWSKLRPALVQVHADELAEYNAAVSNAESNWQRFEAYRVDVYRRLIAGEEALVESVVSSVLEDLDFPFEAAVEYAMEDITKGYLHVDLPELEDIIPHTRHRILKDGRRKESNRTVAERNALYADLVCGLALQLASEVFFSAPTHQEVFIAAYTQRKNNRTGEFGDDYIYVLRIPRAMLYDIDAETIDPFAFVQRLPGHIRPSSNRALKTLPASVLPEWVSEFRGPRLEEV